MRSWPLVLLLLVHWSRSTLLITTADLHAELKDGAVTSRRLSGSGNAGLFRAISGYGFRTQSNAAILPNLSLEACATACVRDAACLAFDLEASTCYIAHTDRYAHPADFLPRPASTHYEWQGAVATPTIAPNGGVLTSYGAVQLFTTSRQAAIWYALKAVADGATTNYAAYAIGTTITLPEYPCYVLAYATKAGLTDSAVLVSNPFTIYATKYMYLVPFYNGYGFHGLVTQVQLDVQGVKRPRPSRVLEFTDINTTLGIGPYTNQLQTINLTAYDPRLAGFYDGFTAVTTVGYANVSLQSFRNTSRWVLIPNDAYTPAIGDYIYNPSLRRQEEYLYLCPYQNALGYSGVIAKVNVRGFQASTRNDPPFLPLVHTLDLTTIDASLTGFSACFTSGNYGYFVQRRNANGLAGCIVRVDLTRFGTPASAVTVLNATAIDARFVGFSGAVVFNNVAYLVPFERNKVGLERNVNYKHFPTATSSVVGVVDLTTFATVTPLDLAVLDPKYACGYFGGFLVSQFVYFVPYMWTTDTTSPEVNPYHGLLTRLNTKTQTLEQLDLTTVDISLRGFMRGFAFGRYAILVPHRNGLTTQRPMRLNQPQKHNLGTIVAVDNDNFTPSGVRSLDLTLALRSQIPNMPDADLRGFIGGGVSGEYGFFVPYFNGVRFSGKVVRVNLRTFGEVQVLDMTQQQDTLRGFTNAVFPQLATQTQTSLWNYVIPDGTQVQYNFITIDM
ncbi:hypothetical protein SDRG_04150 [Saprolegnia diclina VS20]|uniref:Apple domain-containing protein n=1 Tax=Saprolegnia diclina (strain VS20) TaxID=1156394 RepID=T0QUW1_SAPDV|nr:hypothetical protein SDRG_04150 [Saprolegnia diclina VS20]EQC38441.1 hypothetical protein SDRG_04150 [Saprolegnia diclina VS20]|eukprot:XP_008608033.1 hypothetical protein SDRG_04150 [Saprolegnia diclina VS20]